MRADAAARIAISCLAVASGTGAFLALATGHRTAAIGFAVTGGVLGVASVFGESVRLETNDQGSPGSEPAGLPAPVPVASAIMAGRFMGRAT